jgi:phage-related protein
MHFIKRKKGKKATKQSLLKDSTESGAGGTYRAIYTVKFKEAIAVLHVFQKKSKHGIATPKQDVDLIKSRFKLARHEYETWLLKRRKS